MDAQAYLLAAGAGQRAGGPKAWLSHGGRPLLERQLDFLRSLFAPSDIAVSIQRDWSERCRELSEGVRWTAVDSGEPALSALQSLLGSAPSRGWAFVYHVDMPVWEPELFRALHGKALERPAAVALVPEQAGRRGHPVLLSMSACENVLALDPSEDRLDHFLRTASVESVSVPFASIHENWNSGVPA